MKERYIVQDGDVIGLNLMFEVSVIIPTFNESQNILRVINEIENDQKIVIMELLFVDNSPDGTADTVKKYTTSNGRFPVSKELGKRAFFSSYEGYALSTKKHIVIDGDGQHDPKIWSFSLKPLRIMK